MAITVLELVGLGVSHNSHNTRCCEGDNSITRGIVQAFLTYLTIRGSLRKTIGWRAGVGQYETL